MDAGLRVVEFSAFVAAPSAGLALVASTGIGTLTTSIANLEAKSTTGDITIVNGGTTNTANANTNLFDSASNTLTRCAEMKRPRWYSSVTTLASGDVLIQGGLSGADFPEIRRETGALSLLSTAPTGGFDYWYPRNFVGQDGRVFGFDIAGRMYFLDPQGTGSIERLDNLVTDLVGTGSSAVLYACLLYTSPSPRDS